MKAIKLAALLLGVMLLACASSAWAVPGIDPGRGTIGTQFNISGIGFGTVPGKVLFWPDNPVLKPPRITIVNWTDSQIVARVGACAATMECDVQVVPKGAASPITIGDTFGIRRPGIDYLNPISGAVNTSVTIFGEYFGTVKPRVYFVPQTIGAKAFPCKVLAFSDSSVDILAPAKAAPGIYHVWVINPVGADGVDTAFEIVGP